MLTLQTALAERESAGHPVLIGLVGSGFMGRGIALQLCTPLPGMRLVAIANRNVDGARSAWAQAGMKDVYSAKTQRQLDNAIAQRKPVATADADLLCHAADIEVLIDATSDVEFGARTALEAIAGRKHLVLMNAALDATLGPILKVKADEAGVIISDSDGDEPGLAMQLIRYVEAIGYRPVMAGNLKGFLDRYRTPETQRDFANRTQQNPVMCSAYADGTKLNIEACIIANATGMKVARRGMFGPRCNHVNELLEHLQQHRVTPEQLLDQPLVDYVLGAQPGAGIFVVGYNDEPAKRHYMSYLKMGDGPLYVFYRPHVLPHLEIVLTAAQAVLLGQATIAPRGAPVCEVVTVAKRDLKAGDALDGVGGFAAYGLVENADVSRRENLLPIGLSAGCSVLRDVPRDATLSYSDVELPAERISDRLWRQQINHFAESARTNLRLATNP